MKKRVFEDEFCILQFGRNATDRLVGGELSSPPASMDLELCVSSTTANAELSMKTKTFSTFNSLNTNGSRGGRSRPPAALQLERRAMSEEKAPQEGASSRRAMSDSRRGRQSATYAELSDDEFLNTEPKDVAKGGGAAEEASDREDEHDDLCEYCHIGGELLCCDNCTNVYHLKCLEPPLQKLPPGIWNCPDCQFTCEREKCRANGGEMQCCCCGRRFHLACTGQGGALPTPHECASWTCTGCLSSFGVDKILWRRRS
jgi:hypothetical protein